MPPGFEQIGNRPFSFYPPVVNIEHNEWHYRKATWSEVFVVNAKTGLEIWIPRLYIGAISRIEEPVVIVGLSKELEYKGGQVWPYVRRIIEMPRAVNEGYRPTSGNPSPSRPPSSAFERKVERNQEFGGCWWRPSPLGRRLPGGHNGTPQRPGRIDESRMRLCFNPSWAFRARRLLRDRAKARQPGRGQMEIRGGRGTVPAFAIPGPWPERGTYGNRTGQSRLYRRHRQQRPSSPRRSRSRAVKIPIASCVLCNSIILTGSFAKPPPQPVDMTTGEGHTLTVSGAALRYWS